MNYDYEIRVIAMYISSFCQNGKCSPVHTVVAGFVARYVMGVFGRAVAALSQA